MKPLPAELSAALTLHGLSAFTTVRTRFGRPLLLAEHLARLAATCAFLGLPPPEYMPPLLEPLPWGLLRLTATAQGTFWSHLPLPPPVVPALGVSVRLTAFQVHPQLGGHKTGNYLPYLLARREAEAHGAFEGLLTGGAGHIADASRSGLLFRSDEGWFVPEGGLPSITRSAWLAELGTVATVRAVPVSVLRQARHVWLCGAGMGVVPVGQVAGDGWEQTYAADWPQTRHPALVIPD
ncbi:aminotransferase class IV [Deinococcus altitudinis]|uniref:aminotransferase class IV n=1 Tax=Deinococcus altitudinis TaxID=468914 RepID=UPI0038926307